jgi:DNA-binding beta-propeller fold protein YncE
MSDPRPALKPAAARPRRRAASLAAASTSVALALLFLATPASAQALVHPFLFSVHGFIEEPGLVAHPPPEIEDACGVTMDSSGDLYVSDYYHDTIDIFGPSGAYAGQITAVGSPDGPCGLASGPNGDLYVNYYDRDVVRLEPPEFSTGSATVIDSAHPTGLDVDHESGDVYVDDRTSVAEYEPSGALIARIGLGSLQDGFGVAVSDFPATRGFIYVPDAGTGTVKVFDPAVDSTEPVAVIAGHDTPQQGFDSLRDSTVAVDQSNGHVYVLDRLQSDTEHPHAAVDEFDPSGTYLSQIAEWEGESPERPGILTEQWLIDGEPSGLAVDPSSEDVYVTSGNSENASVDVFGPADTPLATLAVLEAGTGQGAVTSAPPGIQCGAICEAEYEKGAQVTLSASPETGSAFAGWSGCSSRPGPNECEVTLGNLAKVTASFAKLGSPAPSAPGSGGAGGPLPSTPPFAHIRSHRRLRLLKASVTGTTASLTVRTAGPGLLSASARGLRPLAGVGSEGGEAILRLRLDGSAHRALERAADHRLVLRVAVVFRPKDGGAAMRAFRSVTFTTGHR